MKKILFIFTTMFFPSLYSNQEDIFFPSLEATHYSLVKHKAIMPQEVFDFFRSEFRGIISVIKHTYSDCTCRDYQFTFLTVCILSDTDQSRDNLSLKKHLVGAALYKVISDQNENDTAEIVFLKTDEKYRRSKIATSMIDVLQKDYDFLFLNGLSAAQPFYKKMGFIN